MKSCQEVSRLLSESMDRRLSLRERVGLWFHLGMCRLCRGFSRELRLLRDAARRHAEQVETDTGDPDAVLSPEARDRLKRVLDGRES